MRKKYKDIDLVVKQLNRKNDIHIINGNIYVLCNHVYSKKLDRMIVNPDKKFDLGNKSWGKIDFLLSHFYFKISYLPNFNKFKLNYENYKK